MRLHSVISIVLLFASVCNLNLVFLIPTEFVFGSTFSLEDFKHVETWLFYKIKFVDRPHFSKILSTMPATFLEINVAFNKHQLTTILAH